MRRMALPGLIAGALAACAGGGFIPASPEPMIQVDRVEHNFGKIPDSGPVSHVFTVKNIGGKPLNISRIQTSCGCTAAVMDNQFLQPGESTRLKVQFDPRGRRGAQSKSIMIHSNDPAFPRKHLRFVATVEPRIPPGGFPTVRQGPAPSATLSP
jgi:hypothetical protein